MAGTLSKPAEAEPRRAGRHLTSIADLDEAAIGAMLKRAAAMEKDPRAVRDLLEGRIVCTAFFEPSTRTRLSFEAAAQRMVPA